MVGREAESLWKGVAILSLAGLLGKVISAGYRVPLQNITGDVGFYIYQQIYPILGGALVLSLYGFPAAVSKNVAENHRETLSVRSFAIPVLRWLMVVCFGVFILGYLSAPQIAEWMADVRLISPLRWAFSVFLLVPPLALLRGVHQGYEQMKPSAQSQIIEQLVRVAGIMITAVVVHQIGNLYLLGKGVAIGTLTGSFLAVLLLLAQSNKQIPWSSTVSPSLSGQGRRVALYGLLISLHYMMLIILQWIDALTLVPGLKEAQVEDARMWKGIFDRGQPLIQLGTVLASSVALAILPKISKGGEQSGYVASSLKVSFIIGLGATAGLIALFPRVNMLLFQSAEGTGPLRILMLVIVISSLVLTVSSVLQGRGQIWLSSLVIIAGGGVKLVLNMWLVPHFQLYGSAIASIAAVSFIFAGQLWILHRESIKIKWGSLPWLRVLFSSAVMAVVVFVLQWWDLPLLHNRLWLLVYTLLLCAIGAFLYFMMLVKLHVFTDEEIRIIPVIKKWKR